MSKDVNCPYCGAEQDINHDDGVGYAEYDIEQQECPDCGKTFVFTVSLCYYYDVEKADCLNDAEHQFEETRTIPRCFRRMRCKVCGEEKEIEGIAEERKAYIAELRGKPAQKKGNIDNAQ